MKKVIFSTLLFFAVLIAVAKPGKPSISKTPYGEINGQQIYQYTLTNSNGMQVKVINFGATITDILAPDRDNKLGDVVLGFDSLKQYLGRNNALLGAAVGRVANRISNKKFTLDGKEYLLPSNIHSGPRGFDKQVWAIEEVPGNKEVALKLTYLSKDGENGFPGNLNTIITYTLTNNNELKLSYIATTDKATPVVITNHTYFNLSGTTEKVNNVQLTILADKYLEADKDVMPSGKLLDVKGTPFDFTKPKEVGKDIAATGNGYDLNYALNNTSGKMALAATAYEPTSGRVLQTYTTEPCLVVYTGNHFNERIIGRNGQHFNKWGALCLETMHFPDSPNQPTFPNVILRPGETFKSETIYKFSVRKQ
ncbi:MAG: aldose epimerase family protein [Bacteroidota bacterium]